MNEVERESLRKNLLNKAKAEKLSALEEKKYYPSQEIIGQVWLVVSVIQQILVLATPQIPLGPTAPLDNSCLSNQSTTIPIISIPIVPIVLPWDAYRRGG